MSAGHFSIETIAQELANVVPGLRLHQRDYPGITFSEFAFDSRRLPDAPATLFVALGGDQRDGHAFVADAYEKGVRHFLLKHSESVPGPANVLLADDPLQALQAIAAWHRRQLDYPILAITGSNGKTVVKEWLASVLEPKMRLGKSPGSFNSQIGVPLSLLELRPGLDLGIIEAGISKPGEMEKLAAMIQPDYGIITHFGDAHAEGFASAQEKLREKLLLFKGCRLLMLNANDEPVLAAAQALGTPLRTVGQSPDAKLHLHEGTQADGGSLRILLSEDSSAVIQELTAPFEGDAARENLLLVILAARQLGMEWNEIREELRLLHPVSMRTELISDNPDLSIINDAYNADRASVRNAFTLLEASKAHPGKVLILTDLEHLGREQAQVQEALLHDAIRRFGTANIVLIGPVFSRISSAFPGLRAFKDTDAFLAAFEYEHFRGKTVLLKGARRFALERIVPFLSRRAVATWFKVNMNHLAHNYRRFRARIPAETRIMCMVKAFSYGAGTWEIAQALAQEGVDYLAVAYTSEGIALRTRGIHTPILIMNADTDSIEQLFRFRLEPEIYGLPFLRTYVRLGRSLGIAAMKVHIKVDTGMHRLGFNWEEAAALQEFLQENKDVEVVSVMSHLSSSDEPGLDAFTLEQVRRFEHFFAEMGFPAHAQPMRHILNTAGILRFPQFAWEMVRLGIGLYGVSPLSEKDSDLLEIGSLHTVITQIHPYPPGTPIGYSCSEKTAAASRIATIPVGYADGIRRSLSNGVGKFLVHGQRAPVVGRVCMDMLMLDVTHIPEAKEGDEVVLIGGQGNAYISVAELAEWCGTIPYEILTGISQRVRRVYVRE